MTVKSRIEKLEKKSKKPVVKPLYMVWSEGDAEPPPGVKLYSPEADPDLWDYDESDDETKIERAICNNEAKNGCQV